MTLAARDRQSAFPLVSAGVLAINVLLNVALIPSLGRNGAAIAMSAAQLVLTAAMVLMVVRAIGGASFIRIFVGTGPGVLAMAAIWLLLGSGVGPMLIALCVYLAVLASVEWRLHGQDLQLLIGALRFASPTGAMGGPAAPPSGAVSRDPDTDGVEVLGES
jgi:O-antigen/teichoic acid export membrane protein